MTFEEFLLKKKIDPVLLRNADPAWYSEFNSHYDQMGAKSFDHSKKFLFNKLRRSYHLKEAPKPVSEPVVQNKPPSAEPSSVPVFGVYVPRFKSGAPSGKSKSADTPESSVGDSGNSKSVYKPRFKAPASVKPEKTPAEELKETKLESPAEDKPKPAYKPRFSTKTIKPVQDEIPVPPPEDQSNEDHTLSDQPVKQPYKPKFRPGITPPSTEE
jgi:hypothetical protein